MTRVLGEVIAGFAMYALFVAALFLAPGLEDTIMEMRK